MLLVPQDISWGHTSTTNPRPRLLGGLHCLLQVQAANPVKVLKCLTKLKRSLCSSPLSGTLNFSL